MSSSRVSSSPSTTTVPPTPRSEGEILQSANFGFFFADLLSDGELQRCLSISGELGVYVAGTAAGPPPLSDSTAGHLSPAVVDHLPAGATRLHLHASARKPSTTKPVPTHLHLHAGATHLHLHTSASRQRARRSKKVLFFSPSSLATLFSCKNFYWIAPLLHS